MKVRMILAALVVGGAVVAMQAPAAALIITNTYLVGDKDDFDDVDGDAVHNLATGAIIPEGSGPGEMKFWDMPLPDPEDGLTDTEMKARPGWPPFDFTFNVGADPAVLVSGLLRVATWNVGYNAPGTWDKQPIVVSTASGDVLLPTTLTKWAAKYGVVIDEIPLSAAALADVAGGGEVHLIIGSEATFLSTDVCVIDYAELELTYEENGGGDPVPEGSSAMLLATGLAGLAARRRRRK